MQYSRLNSLGRLRVRGPVRQLAGLHNSVVVVCAKWYVGRPRDAPCPRQKGEWRPIARSSVVLPGASLDPLYAARTLDCLGSNADEATTPRSDRVTLMQRRQGGSKH